MGRNVEVVGWFRGREHPLKQAMRPHPGLVGDGPTARVMGFAHLADVEARAAGLERVLRSWISWKEA